MEVLPTVARLLAADRSRAPRVRARFVDRQQRQAEGAMFRPQRGPADITRDRRDIVRRVAAKARREQRIGPQRRVALQAKAQQQNVATLRGTDPQGEDEARMTMDDFDGGRAWTGQAQLSDRACATRPRSLRRQR